MNFLLLLVFFLTVYIYEFASSIFGFYKYTDEMLVLFLAIISAVFLLKKEFTLLNKEKYILRLSFLLLIIGLIGNYLSEAQKIGYAMFDALLVFKFLIVYFSVRIISSNTNEINYVIKGGYSTVYLLLFFFLFVAVIFDRTFSVFPIYDYRFGGIASTELFFGHPSRYAFAMQCLFILLLPLIRFGKRWIHLLLVVLILGSLSLRVKFFVFIPIAVFVLIFLSSVKNKIAFNRKFFLILPLMFIGVFIIAGERIESSFFLHDDGVIYARGALVTTGFDIATANFPVGAGFGSFASHVSAVSYSPIYYDYDLDRVYGLTPDHPMFVSDTYIGLLLGQFGFSGFFVFVCILILFFRILIDGFNSSLASRHYFIGGLLILTVLTFDSFSDTIFSQSRAIFPFVLIAVLVSKYQHILERKGGN